nr:hypothetical protein [Leucobacter sp. G161]
MNLTRYTCSAEPLGEVPGWRDDEVCALCEGASVVGEGAHWRVGDVALLRREQQSTGCTRKPHDRGESDLDVGVHRVHEWEAVPVREAVAVPGTPPVGLDVHDIDRWLAGEGRVDDAITAFAGEAERLLTDLLRRQQHVVMPSVLGRRHPPGVGRADSHGVAAQFEVPALGAERDLEPAERSGVLVAEERDVHDAPSGAWWGRPGAIPRLPGPTGSWCHLRRPGMLLVGCG